MKVKKLLEAIFQELDSRIGKENSNRQGLGSSLVPKIEIRIMGQMSLLLNDKISASLSLAQTKDVDALLSASAFALSEFKKILLKHGLVYDEDSEKVWLPKGAKFEMLFVLENIEVKILDPESALLSKAIKAPEKNKYLIREAIASGKFPNLADKIIQMGGELDFFAED